jgi:hypothetical protein
MFSSAAANQRLESIDFVDATVGDLRGFFLTPRRGPTATRNVRFTPKSGHCWRQW